VSLPAIAEVLFSAELQEMKNDDKMIAAAKMLFILNNG
jgi:hypothetical protein